MHNRTPDICHKVFFRSPVVSALQIFDDCSKCSFLFVGPNYTRHGTAFAEHLQCEYLPALEIACLPELAPHLPASYSDTCAKLERGPDGKIVLPQPDVAPSCS